MAEALRMELASIASLGAAELYTLRRGERRIITEETAWWQEVYGLLHAQPWIEKHYLVTDTEPENPKQAAPARVESPADRLANAAAQSARMAIVARDSDECRDRAEAAERIANAAKALGWAPGMVFP